MFIAQPCVLTRRCLRVGYPFGFERIPGIVQRAFGKVPPNEFWVITDNQHASVRKEYTVWCLVYGMLAAGCGAWGTVFAAPLWDYWILPHCIGWVCYLTCIFDSMAPYTRVVILDNP